MSRTFKIKMEQQPLQGKVVRTQISAEGTAAATTVAEVAKAQGLSLKNMNVYVDGVLATEKTPLVAGSVLRLEERPKGS